MFDPDDFRAPVPEDRVIALRAIIEAKGDAIPKLPVCHGKANGCQCPACAPGKYRRKGSVAA